jgi:hexosaminidase
MRNFFAAILLVLFLTTYQFAQSDEINIIPRPQFVKSGADRSNFVISRKTKIDADTDVARQVAAELNAALNRDFGFTLGFTSKRQNDTIVINLTKRGPGESYGINVTSQEIMINGEGIGLFHAQRSLVQMFSKHLDGSVRIPAVEIRDQPRFPYRGMHLDVARHFQPVEFVKKFIDQMSKYKFNYFHWHLTEDQGWRIEIKKYPRLTEIGSKRPESHEGSYSPTFKGDGRPIEGFYTQEQIRDVVAYAKARHITVIPEIELPGHASAALAAYPQFGCKADYDYKVKMTWGIFKETFCPTDETFKFLEDVLTETIALFPDSPYIHIGGDEVLKDHWKESAFVQDLMKRENLKDEHEVQSYFIRRIEKFINLKGKKMIGWDEILEGGLAPNATVMSWRGMKGGIEAAKAKHDVIMSPNDFAYFDHGQGDPAYEPLNIGGYSPLEEVYSSDILPKELTPEEAKYVIGGQANLWTEYLETPAAVEYMAFPRMLALSEILWSKKEDRNFTDFQRRLFSHLPRLDKQGVNYRIPEPVGLANAVIPEGQAISIGGIRSEIPGAKVHVTVDGSTPTEKSPLIPSRFVANPDDGEVLTLKTIVVLPNGRKSAVYAATFVRGEMREPDVVADTKPGVSYRFGIPTSENNAQETSGETTGLGLAQFANKSDLKMSFFVGYTGYLKIPADGIYEFQTDTTWGSSVTLGDAKVIPFNEGTAERSVRSAIVPLKAGLHKVTLFYQNKGGEPSFRFRYGIKGQGLRQAYGGEFVH